ncbi:SUKH-4 family immunity protein [Xanthomonas translucens]|uniref:SUKH-4 family immunity protein n=1 Tax=Xanthomonas campestris pv. translucens TaxID=343 RepID=UPI000AFDB173|nr:SUKH-4 family immunity protein [Xanthomonas translucens]MBC3974136.1 SUKH-4 family immunity protein [Xanthomonas translucens pv. undulosa]MCT8284055.1 SUKH-4 family immunity protein [Xanthomonas translucens pv. undulosa]MCT8318868.1 SUKH-4 family immunity protein [Xanthomonas translucens pv. undulosa]QSQ43031.1 SUKH-4 family immunity protein [Xanthomonas translucens pv. translucens]QSQ49117.1 SUKH-4 family immunity protein [Xanthomonas translucens pv. undulosa]
MKLDDNLLISHSEFLGVQDLIGKELPDFNCADPSFGFVFFGPERVAAGKKDFLAFAKVVDGSADRIGVAVSTGEIFAFYLDFNKTKYVNDSVASFLFFLDKMIAFKIILDELDPDPPAMTLTVEESNRFLERFERGELKPRGDDSKRKENEAILKRKFRELKSSLRERDSKALRGAAWWGGVIEEINEGFV